MALPPNADTPRNLTLTLGTSSWSAELSSISWDGVTQASIDTSHFGLSAPAATNFGGRTFIPGDLADPGELTFSGNFNPNDPLPFLDGTTELVTVGWPTTGGTVDPTWAGQGFATSFSMEGEDNGKMSFTISFKMTGEITVTEGAD